MSVWYDQINNVLWLRHSGGSWQSYGRECFGFSSEEIKGFVFIGYFGGCEEKSE